ncbi:hypothetical protein Tco_1299834 [Tanacetum coccineum]
MTGVKSYLYKYVEQPGPKVVFGDNSSCITEGYGIINCGGIVFSKVAFINGLKYILISISQLCDAKYIVQFDDKYTWVHFLKKKSHAGKFDAKADDGYFLRYSFNSKAFRVFNARRQQIHETYHVTFDKSIEAIRFTNTSVDEIRINDSFRYPPDEFLQEDDPSRQYQANFDISYYIIPHGRLLNELTQDTHVPEVITSNKQNAPHIEDVKGPSDLVNTEGTQEQNIQDEQINHQL